MKRDYEPSLLGQTIKKIRRGLKLRQWQLADSAGVSRSAISRIERGYTSTMTLEQALAVARELGADVRLSDDGRPYMHQNGAVKS